MRRYTIVENNKNNNSNNNNLRGGRPALPSAWLLCSGPVITGEPGIRLAHSSFGLAHSLLPALCCQATSCAWRLRLRKLPYLESMAVPRGDLRARWGLMWVWGGSVAGREATWRRTATTRREKWSRTGTRQTLRTVSF